MINNEVKISDTRQALFEYWTKNLANIDSVITNEFNTIVNQDKPMIEATKDYNYGRSKYNKIYPYDYNRVILKEMKGSDFINASFIEQPNGRKKYIAAQAPTSNTIYDFLRMICEKNIKKILMLVNLNEDNKSKCEPYWDDDKVLVVDNIEVKVIKHKKNKNYFIKRTFELTKTDDSKFCHKVIHYHYNNWPDKSVPECGYELIQLLKYINCSEEKYDPILVHCSAGIGRTGTLISLDILIDAVNNNSKINIKDTVQFVRNQRVNMVQTWDQYKLLYKILIYDYLFGETIISIKDYRNKYDHHNYENDENINKIKIEYKKLVNFEQEMKSTKTFEKFNQKFHSQVFKPMDDYLIELNRINKDPSSAVIDAVSIKSLNRIPVEFIVATSPTDERIEDYLRLIFHCRPKYVFSFSRNPFLPETGKSMQIVDFTIKSTYFTCENGLKFYHVFYKNLKSKEDHEVFYYDHKDNWNDNLTPWNVNLFIVLLEKCMSIIDEENNIPVFLVQSKDSGDKSATFISCLRLIYSLNNTKTYDVVDTVFWLRKYRENMISKLLNYNFLYDFCQFYIENKILGLGGKNKETTV